MQCVILAAGEGTRMRPLTLEKPKPLIEVCGKPIIWHIINALPENIDEVVLVVSYKKELIQAYCGEFFLGRKITYVVQENPKGGTAEALFCARSVLAGTFLVMYGDDIHGAHALAEVVALPHGMLSAYSETPEKFGVLSIRENGTLKEILEKPEQPPSHFVNIGGFVVTTAIFDFEAELSVHGEYLLTDCITAYAQQYPVVVVPQDTWIPLGYPSDIAKAESILCP